MKPYYLLLFLIGFRTSAQSLAGMEISTQPTSLPALSRVISLAPNLTEIICEVGIGKKLAGITNYDQYPPEILNLPRLGGYLNPDIEMIIKLKPDAVLFLQGRSDVKRKLEEFNIRTFEFRCESLEEILETIRRLGEIFNVDEQSGRLIEKIQESLRINKTCFLPAPRVLIVLGTAESSLTRMYAAGRNSFITQIIELLGAVNIFKNINLAYTEVSFEEIIARNPDLIIELFPVADPQLVDVENRKKYWRKYDYLEAVKKDRLTILTDEYLLIPGARLPLTIQKLATALKEYTESQ